MSTHLRLAKGTGLTLARVVAGIAGQIITVPIYLSNWDAHTYGVWLIFLGLQGYLSLISVAYQRYTYAEVLKCGRDAREDVHRVYWASLAVGYVIAAVEFAAILSFAPLAVSTMLEPEVASGGASVIDTIILLLVLFGLLNLVIAPFGAITQLTMTIHGYYPRLAAWGLFHSVVMLFLPAVAVAFGADFMAAGLALVTAHSISATLALFDILRIAKRYELLERPRVDWRKGFLNALYSLPLAGQAFIDSLRQQGFRILLGAYAGATSVTALATTRTFANVLQKGLGALTGPLMPELMRYVVDRDQDRMEGAFAIVWLSVFALLVPGILLLMLLAEPVFLYWTRGAVDYDAVLYLTLLVVVAVYASVQPANAILHGQNRVAWIVSAAVAAGLGLVALSLMLIPPFGLRGAGFALLGAEFCALAVSVKGAVRSLRHSGLHFPLSSFALVIMNTVSVFGLTLLNATVLAAYPAFIALSFAVNLLFAAAYWARIPVLAREKIHSLLGKMIERLLGRARVRA